MNTSKPRTLSQRDRDFITACRRFIAASGKKALTASQIAAGAAASPAPSYYITYDYAMRKLSEPADTTDTPSAQRMADIRQRVERLMQSRGLEQRHALSLVLADTSPKGFFLSESTAVRLFHRLRRKPHLRRPLDQ